MITHKFQDKELFFTPTPQAPALIAEIFGDNYRIVASNLSFSPRDIILDIGANEGMFSIYMATLFPETRILAFEPVPRTYEVLVKNLRLNNIYSVSAYNIGIGKPGQTEATMIVGRGGYSGGSSTLITYKESDHEKTKVVMRDLDLIFEAYDIDKCKLLKMDIEGGEYDALYPCTVLDRIENMVIEIHTNARLDYESRRMDGLVNWLNNRTRLIHVELCRMAE